MTNKEKHLIWTIGLVIITIILCTTIIWINYNSWTIRFEMDENTKEAIESLDLREFNPYQTQYSVNETLLKEKKYQIMIDCNFINEHINDDTLAFDRYAIDLCEEYFPELNYKRITQ